MAGEDLFLSPNVSLDHSNMNHFHVFIGFSLLLVKYLIFAL